MTGKKHAKFRLAPAKLSLLVTITDFVKEVNPRICFFNSSFCWNATEVFCAILLYYQLLLYLALYSGIIRFPNLRIFSLFGI
jgi:hypothetical protein